MTKVIDITIQNLLNQQISMINNKKRNILLITIDCLRADFSEIFINPMFVFNKNDHFANAPFTSGSFKSLMFGELPLSGNSGLNVCDPKNCIAEHLSNLGYYTIGIHSNPYLHRLMRDTQWSLLEDVPEKTKQAYALRKLFVKLMRKIGINIEDKINILKPAYTAEASQITGRALDIVKRIPTSKPVFLWIHYMDAHFPYNLTRFNKVIPQKKIVDIFKRFYDDRITNNDIPILKNIYSNALLNINKSIKKLVDLINMQWNEPIIILTSDHGEGFNEHKFISHKPFLFDELLHVPLLANTKLYMNRSITSHLDLYVEILRMAGISDNMLPQETKNYLKSITNSLGNAVPGEVLSDFNNDKGVPKLSIRTKQCKYYYDGEYIEYFDLIKNPCEDINSKEQLITIDLNSIKDRYEIVSSRFSIEPQLENEMDEKLGERLRGLGYL